MATPRRASIKRKILRGGNDHRALERHLLRHRELRVAGARRHVDDHDVEFAPLHFAQHLGDADITIGPRQIIGVSSSIRKPIDMTVRP